MKKSIDYKNLNMSYQLLQPTQPALVTTKNKNGTLNVAPFNWITPVSAEPPILLLSLLTIPKKQDSLINIERTMEFGVNIPQIELATKLVKASYNYPPDSSKYDILEFTLQKPTVIDIGLIEECRVNLECKARKMELIGDHTMIIADIVAAHYDDKYFDENLVLNLETVTPCHHLKKFIFDNGQKHIFMAKGERIEIFEPYPEMR